MDFDYITNITQLGSLAKELPQASAVCLDTETTTLDPYTATLLLLQLSVNDKIFILDARKLGKKIITYVIQLIKDSNKLVIGHNLKFDTKILYHNTGEILMHLWDTMLGETMIYNGLGKSFYPSYEELCSKYCMIELNKQIRETFINFDGEFDNNQLTYSAMDVKFLTEIFRNQITQLSDQHQTGIAELEMALIPVVMTMEYFGIKLNKDKWLAIEFENKKLLEEKHGDIINYIIGSLDFNQFDSAYTVANTFRVPVRTKKLEAELKSISGSFSTVWFSSNFNINSPIQMLTALNLLGVPCKNTNEKTINKFKDNQFVKLLLEYREVAKRISTYGSSFLENINPVTGYIHTNYNQLGAASGRFSSDGAQMQNQPGDERYRNSYESRPGYKFINADYSQAELRALGSITGDKVIIDCYKNNIDLHSRTASIIYNLPIEEIDKKKRYVGKQVNFGVIYGISAWGLYKNFSIPQEEGEVYLDNYYKGYPQFTYFKKKTEERVWEKKYSATIFGRKRFFEDKKMFFDNTEREMYIARVKREGFNHIIQGSIADIIKTSMVTLFNKNPFGLDNFRLLLQTHDELTIEVKDDIIEPAREFVRDVMEKTFQTILGEIPAKVDIIVADCWTKDESKGL